MIEQDLFFPVFMSEQVYDQRIILLIILLLQSLESIILILHGVILPQFFLLPKELFRLYQLFYRYHDLALAQQYEHPKAQALILCVVQ